MCGLFYSLVFVRTRIVLGASIYKDTRYFLLCVRICIHDLIHTIAIGSVLLYSPENHMCWHYMSPVIWPLYPQPPYYLGNHSQDNRPIVRRAFYCPQTAA